MSQPIVAPGVVPSKPAPPDAPTCKHCGGVLAWRWAPGTEKWYPVDPATRQYHVCAQRPARVVVDPVEPVEPATMGGEEATPEPVRQARPSGNGKADGLAAAIAAAVGPMLSGAVDADAVRAIVAEEFEKRPASGGVTITVHNAATDALIDVGRQHRVFPDVLELVACRMNVYLTGPSGSGKTHLAGAVARSLSLAFGSCSVCEQTPASDLLGYMMGEAYIETEFFRRYRDGGVFLLDEIDHGSPNSVGVLNQAIGNGHCAFPCGMIEKHAEFVMMAGANTFGTGATRQHVGAVQLDVATLNRFKFVEMPYDEMLETDMAIAACVAAGGNENEARAWVAYVQACRANAARLGTRHVLSPRDSRDGAILLARGKLSRERIESLTLWRGLDAETVSKLRHGA